jgi:hypothetical protein
MRIFMFKSETQTGLGAFAANPDRHKLPTKLGPWAVVGVVQPERAPPHGLDRNLIERGIESQGFQLYRRKAATGG